MAEDIASSAISSDYLQKLLENGNEKQMEIILQAKFLEVNCEFSDGTTPLIHTIRKKQDGLVKLLLEHGAKAGQPCSVSAKPLWLKTPESIIHLVYPLEVAYECENTYVIQMLLGNGAEIDQCKAGIRGLFKLAVKKNDHNLVKILMFRSILLEKSGIVQSVPSLSEPLLLAIQLDNLSMAELLLELGAEANREHSDTLPLVMAAERQNVEMVDMLLKHGATTDKTYGVLGTSHTPLSLALQAGWEKATAMLIQKGCDVNSVMDWRSSDGDVISSTGGNALHLAVCKGKKGLVELLIKAGCDINKVDKEGNTPLHLACKHPSDYKEIVHYLLEVNNDSVQKKLQTLNINCKNHKGQTPLMLAVYSQNVDKTELLLSAGVSVDTQDHAHITALHYAVQASCEELVVALLQARCMVDIGQRRGATPLSFAIQSKHSTIVQILLEHDADPHEVFPKTGQTMLHEAVATQDTVIVQLLLDRGVDVNRVTKLGETPLMAAAKKQNCPGVCNTLIEAGAYIDFRDNNNETALSLSVYYGCQENAIVLIEQGANLSLADKR